jgi:hypothetical protein
MNKKSVLLVITVLLTACSSSFKTVGVINNMDREITIETRPNIRYSGLPEKYIGLEKDSSDRGLVWKFGSINAIVIRPKGAQPAYDSVGKYIMKPKSGFEIGDFYKHDNKEFSYERLDISFLKVLTHRDTIVLIDKKAIWNALNYDKKTKRNRKIFYDKAIVVD